MKASVLALKVACLAVIILGCCVAANASEWVQDAKLLAADGAVNDGFGFSVSMSGNTAIMGLPADDDCGESSGSAYIFERGASGWQQVAKLVASDASPYGNFGHSVSISGETIIVGADGDSSGAHNAGGAYVFQRSAEDWEEVAKLTASDASEHDTFGHSVAIDGDLAIIGAPGYDTLNTGAAYVFERTVSGWVEEAILTASEAQGNDSFGHVVAMSGSRVVVGSLRGQDHLGEALIFEDNGARWNQVAILLPSAAEEGDCFGETVGLSGNAVIVGARDAGDFGSRSGAAYIFETDGQAWTETARLIASDGEADEGFGVRVSIGDDLAVVSAVGDDCGLGSGALYVFQRNGSSWEEVTKLLASDGHAQHGLGVDSVCIDNGVVIAGAVGDDDTATDAGAAYLFRLLEPVPGDANGDRKVDGVDLAYWQQNYDPLGVHQNTRAMGDFNGDNRIDGGDLALWQQNYDPMGPGGMNGTATIPEPGTLVLVSVGLALAGRASWKSSRRKTAKR